MIAWLTRHWTATVRPSARPTPARTTTARARPRLEEMEARDVPAVLGDPTVAIPAFDGTRDSTVRLVSAADGSARVGAIDPFPGYRGALSVAVGDVNGDGTADLIVGAEVPDGHVEVFDGATGNLLQSFFAFPGFLGTTNVGASDVAGKGYADVLVAASGPGSNGHVKAFDGQDGSLLSSFFAFPGFLGTTTVAGADFTGAGAPGVGGRVALFNADGSVYDSGFFAFPGFNGPISVAAGDVTGSGKPDVVVGAGTGAPGGEVEVFDGSDFAPIEAFLPYAPTVANGVNVQLADANRDGVLDIVTTLQGGGNPSLSVFYGGTGQLVALSTGGEGTDSTPAADPTGSGGGAYVAPVTPAPTAPAAPDPGVYTPPDTGTTDPGTSDPTDPGYTDPGCTDPGYTDPGNADPGSTDPTDPNNPGG
jgi:serralysin